MLLTAITVCFISLLPLVPSPRDSPRRGGGAEREAGHRPRATEAASGLRGNPPRKWVDGNAASGCQAVPSWRSC